MFICFFLCFLFWSHSCLAVRFAESPMFKTIGHFQYFPQTWPFYPHPLARLSCNRSQWIDLYLLYHIENWNESQIDKGALQSTLNFDAKIFCLCLCSHLSCSLPGQPVVRLASPRYQTIALDVPSCMATIQEGIYSRGS